jgi:hypothetical protein
MPVFETLARTVHDEAPLPDVDLLIRCGGEQRLSDLFGWECAHAELLFLPLMWPDFEPHDLRAALEEFQRRQRRYGALPVPAHDLVEAVVSGAKESTVSSRRHKHPPAALAGQDTVSSGQEEPRIP